MEKTHLTHQSFKDLIHWSQNFSDLPWRQKRSLYGTLVSEIMLQQTTVGAVLMPFERFMNRFDDLEELAKSELEEVLNYWKGLGYYRRARLLHAAAKFIWDEHGGEIPLDYKTLLKIPGIGEYTANALLAIGANQAALSLDGNLERVLARFYAIESESGIKLKKELKELYASGDILESLPQLGPRALNEALMDLGRTTCLPKNPRCLLCPLSPVCVAKIKGIQEQIPRANPKKKKSFKLDLIRLMVSRKNRQECLMVKRPKGKWLTDQWELPTYILKTEDDSLNQYPQGQGHWKRRKALGEFTTLITKYKITNHILAMGAREYLDGPGKVKGQEDFQREQKYFSMEDISQGKAHFSTATLKALRCVLNSNVTKH